MWMVQKASKCHSPYDIPIALKFGELLAEPIVIFKEFADSSNRGD